MCDHTEILPNDIIKFLSTFLDLETLQNLSNSCTRFHHINYPIIDICKSLRLTTLPNWILTNNWAKLLCNNIKLLDHIKLPKIVHYNELLLELIITKSFHTIKFITEYMPNLFYEIKSHTRVRISILRKYFKTDKNFVDFCQISGIRADKNNDYDINHGILIFAYFWGSKEILELLLKTNIIPEINNNYIYNPFYGKNLNSGNIINFINEMELRNQWETKSAVFKKISFKLLFNKIKNNQIYLVKKIIKNFDKSIFDNNISKDLFLILLKLKHNNFSILDKLISELKNNKNLKIKHLLIFLGYLFELPSMTKIIFNSLTWSESDIQVFKDIDCKYSSDIFIMIYLTNLFIKIEI
jgi:hypothetical protein